MSYDKTLIALCPECALSAHREPDLDKGDQIAFKCDGTHPVFWLPLSTLPAAVAQASEVGPSKKAPPDVVEEPEPPKKPRSHR